MKLNKMLMMATLAVGGLSIGLPVQAQDSNAPAATPPPMRRPAFTLDGMAKQLDLTDDQKAKVKPIMEDQQKQRAEIGKDTSLSQEDRRAKMKELRDATGAKLKEVLTAEQYAKWEKMGPPNRRPAPAAPAADAPPKN